jgi:hypothetical protein
MADGDADAGQELRHRERLGDVVVGALVEGQHLAMIRAVGGQHDDGDVGPRAQPAADVDAVDVGQAEVEDDDVGRLADDELQRDLAPGRRHDAVAACAQARRERPEDRRFVVDDEDGRGLSHPHVPFAPAA